MKKMVFALIFILFMIPSLCFCQCYGVRLKWDANEEVDLEGYRVFMRTEYTDYDYDYPNVEVDRSTTEALIQNIPEGVYAWVIRAFDTQGNESGDSNEVGPVSLHDMYIMMSTPPANPGGCMISDVFQMECL